MSQLQNETLYAFLCFWVEKSIFFQEGTIFCCNALSFLRELFIAKIYTWHS